MAQRRGKGHANPEKRELLLQRLRGGDNLDKAIRAAGLSWTTAVGIAYREGLYAVEPGHEEIIVDMLRENRTGGFIQAEISRLGLPAFLGRMLGAVAAKNNIDWCPAYREDDPPRQRRKYTRRAPKIPAATPALAALPKDLLLPEPVDDKQQRFARLRDQCLDLMRSTGASRLTVHSSGQMDVDFVSTIIVAPRGPQ